MTEFEQLKENAEVVVIAHENPQAQNTMNQPDVITPKLEIVSVEQNQVPVDIEANSVTLVRLGYGNSLFEAGVLKAEGVELKIIEFTAISFSYKYMSYFMKKYTYKC